MKFFTLFITLLIGIFTANAQTVTTYAGTPLKSGNSKTATPRLSAKIAQPYGIDIDSKGNVYIAETGNHVISLIYASNDNVQVRVGAVGQASFKDALSTTSRFNAPKGLVVGLNDEVYVADCDNHVIRKISAFESAGNAQTVTVFCGKHGTSGDYYTKKPGYADGGPNVAQFRSPTDIDMDASGNMYVTDKENHCIRKIDPQGNVTTFAGTPETPGFADGPAAQAKFNTPTGIYVNGSDVYVADRLNSRIRKISNGQVTTVVDGLWTPDDVVIIGGSYYVIDQHRIKKYDGSTLTTYAGPDQLNIFGFKDGTGTEARFYNPKCLLVVNTDQLLISDQDNHVLRKIMNCNGFKPTITKNGYVLTATAGTTYQWYIYETAINGATSQSYTVTKTADYSVEVTLANGCYNISDKLHVEYTSSIEDQTVNNWLVYPNPVQDELTISGINVFNSETKISLFDLTGKEIMIKPILKGSEFLINTSELNRGIYFVRIEDGNNLSYSRFIRL